MSKSANDLTKYALKVLGLNGHFVWRQNNLAVPGRKFIGKKGVPDILGISRKGIPLAIETKFNKDRMSEDQKNFREEWIKRHGFYLELKKEEDLQELENAD